MSVGSFAGIDCVSLPGRAAILALRTDGPQKPHRDSPRRAAPVEGSRRAGPLGARLVGRSMEPARHGHALGGLQGVSAGVARRPRSAGHAAAGRGRPRRQEHAAGAHALPEAHLPAEPLGSAGHAVRLQSSVALGLQRTGILRGAPVGRARRSGVRLYPVSDREAPRLARDRTQPGALRPVRVRGDRRRRARARLPRVHRPPAQGQRVDGHVVRARAGRRRGQGQARHGAHGNAVVTGAPVDDGSLHLRVLDRVRAVPQQQWDALVGPESSPFVEWTWLEMLEETGCVGGQTGWVPAHLTLWRGDRLLAVAPSYIKGHSEGEFVFDWSWAEVAERLGVAYYPKVVVAVPFTPATGDRVLVAPDVERRDATRMLADALRQWCARVGASSAHVLFPREDEARDWEDSGYLRRDGFQFHWHRRAATTWDEFMARFSSKQRNQIKRELRGVADRGIVVETL